MFTGLVRTIGTVRRVDQRGDCMVTIAMADPFPIEIGDSICCEGICLTAIKVSGNEFKASLSAETLACTNASAWAVGTRINLEPSLRVGDALGGHFVAGHVDGTARVVAAEQSGDSMIWEFEIPPNLARFIVPKGSVAINGVSLTVNKVEKNGREPTLPLFPAGATPEQPAARPTLDAYFSVNIIPHTSKMTTFNSMAIGDLVNLEIDTLARYVANMLGVQS